MTFLPRCRLQAAFHNNADIARGVSSTNVEKWRLRQFAPAGEVVCRFQAGGNL
jgi:hypothetical protein